MRNPIITVLLVAFTLIPMKAFAAGEWVNRIEYVHVCSDGTVAMQLQGHVDKGYVFKLDPEKTGYHRFELMFSILKSAAETNHRLWVKWNDRDEITDVSLYYN